MPNCEFFRLLTSVCAMSPDRAYYSVLDGRLSVRSLLLVVKLLLLATSTAVLVNGPNLSAAPASEYSLLCRFPASIRERLNDSQPDSQGFVGFHQRDGKWYEAGMQRSGCWMLIGAVVAGDKKRADDAWRSVETTFAHQMEDGGFISNQKPGDAHGPTKDERVETAYFYLQELAHAILVIRASP